MRQRKVFGTMPPRVLNRLSRKANFMRMTRTIRGVLLIAAPAWIAWIAGVLAAAPSGSGTVEIHINPAARFQTIDGFGVNFNGTYFRAVQQPMIDMLINDLGATIFRLDPYGLSNWEVVNDNDDPHDMNWEYYNDRYSIPTFEASWAAARYLNRHGIRIFLTLSGIAPKWMLDNSIGPPQHHVCNKDAGLGPKWADNPVHLNPKMYDEFAEEVVSLAVYARTRARIDFDYFSPMNETDCYPAEGPRIDPDEMPKVLDAIAARMRKEGLGDVKLVVPEQAIVTTDYLDPILKDDSLMKQVGAFSFHTYGPDSVGPQVARVEASPYKSIPVWLTEYGDLNDLDRSAENDWEGFSMAATERALRALNQGASVALFWDAYDNYHEHYPRLTFYGLVQNADGIYTPKKRYYAAKQLYRFVRPGSQRIGASSDSPVAMVAAFRNGESNELVVVGVKRGGPDHIRVSLPSSPSAPAAWELYETTRRLNCVKVNTLEVRDGLAEFDLPSEAIFTLVGKMRTP